jgi:hypothetical protein
MKPSKKRPLRRLMHRWEGDIKMDLTNANGEDLNWIKLSSGRM